MALVDYGSGSDDDLDTEEGTDSPSQAIIHPKKNTEVSSTPDSEFGNTSPTSFSKIEDDDLPLPQESEQDNFPEEEDSSSPKKKNDGEAMEVDEVRGGIKVKIPSEPPGRPSAELQDKVNKLYEKKMQTGLDMNVYIQRNKQFRNPSIYEKLIKHCNIDEFGTNYPPAIYDPHEWTESSYYDELAKTQKADMDRREKEKKERSGGRVEFVVGTKKPTTHPHPNVQLPNIPVASGLAALIEENKRKSKWDQRGSLNMPINLHHPIQPILIQPNLATGTKSKVISAYGNLPNSKPK